MSTKKFYNKQRNHSSPLGTEGDFNVYVYVDRFDYDYRIVTEGITGGCVSYFPCLKKKFSMVECIDYVFKICDDRYYDDIVFNIRSENRIIGDLVPRMIVNAVKIKTSVL